MPPDLGLLFFDRLEENRGYGPVDHSGGILTILFIGDDFRNLLVDFLGDKTNVMLAAMFFVPVKVNAPDGKNFIKGIVDFLDILLPS